jgi:hypothetical protein
VREKEALKEKTRMAEVKANEAASQAVESCRLDIPVDAVVSDASYAAKVCPKSCRISYADAVVSGAHGAIQYPLRRATSNLATILRRVKQGCCGVVHRRRADEARLNDFAKREVKRVALHAVLKAKWAPTVNSLADYRKVGLPTLSIASFFEPLMDGDSCQSFEFNSGGGPAAPPATPKIDASEIKLAVKMPRQRAWNRARQGTRQGQQLVKSISKEKSSKLLLTRISVLNWNHLLSLKLSRSRCPRASW